MHKFQKITNENTNNHNYTIVMMFPKEPSRFLAAIFLGASSLFQVADGIAVGDTICTEGFVMDFFCINRGTLLDRPRVRTLEGPDQHTVKCLIDVGSCVSSPFEILLDPKGNETLYTRGFQLDDTGKEMSINLARSGRSQSNSGFRAAMTATVVNLNEGESIPPTIQVLEMVDTTRYSVDANGGLSACETLLGTEDVVDKEGVQDVLQNVTVSGDAPVQSQSGFTLRQIHLIHGSLMMVSWGFLLPSGTLIAKFFKHRPDGLWFKLHRAIQFLGLLLAVIGWAIALRNFNVFMDVGFHNYRHGICGMTVMILGLMQPLNALIRPHAPENDDDVKTTKRLLWEIWHKSSGYGAVLLAVPTIILGTLSLPNIEDQTKVQVGYGLGCIGGLLLLVAYMFYDKTFYQQNEKAKPPETA